MRWSLLLLLVAIPTLAVAEPKVALAPLEGDKDGKIADIVADVAGERAKVTRPARVESAMRSMGASLLSAKTIKKLRARLDVDVVIHGSVERDGGTRRLELAVSGDGTAKKLDIEFKTTKELRKELAGKLAKRIAAASAGGEDEEDDDERERAAEREREEAKRKQREEEERAAERKRRDDEERQRREDEDRKRRELAAERKRDDERRRRADDEDDDDSDDRKSSKRSREDRDDDDDRRTSKRSREDRDDDRRTSKRDDDRDDRDDESRRARKRVADEDSSRTRRRARDDEDDDEEIDDDDDDDDDDRPRKRKRKRARPRHLLTQTALWLDAGGAVARRTLRYDATGTMQPPPVATAAGAGRIEGELYPLAFSSVRGGAAGLGIHAMYGRTFGLGIAVPGTMSVAPVDSGHSAVGARYRFVFGAHSLAFGVSYWRRHFVADRSKLMNPDQLDMPDVDYTAIAPGMVARIGATPKVSAFASFDFPLMLGSGPIQDPATGYGGSKILAFDIRAGTQIALSPRAALQIVAELDQIGLSFTGQPGSKAATRQVTKATDRTMGIAATIGIVY